MAGVYDESTGEVSDQIPLNAFGLMEESERCSEVAFDYNDYLFTFDIFWTEDDLVGFSGITLSGTETRLGTTTASDKV